MNKIILGTSLCLLLAGCGSSSSSSTVAQPEIPATPTPVVLEVGKQVDLALAKAEAVTDLAEPDAIDEVTVPANEDGEPKAL